MNIPDQGDHGSPHILCEQGQYTVLNTGLVVTKGLWGQPFDGDALAHALRFHGFDGVVVAVRGDQFRGLGINNQNGNLINSVKWTTGNVSNITLFGDTPDRTAKIGTVAVFNKTGDLRVENFTLTNPGGSYCPFIVNANGLVGNMKLYDINFLPQDPTAWQGHGMKWNVRCEGVAESYDLRKLVFHGALEHGLYIDNHLADSFCLNCTGGGMGRTFMQWTNRSQSGPASKGVLVVAHCIATGVGGQGGSDFTFVGNGESPIYFVGNKSIDSVQGSFVHWTDKGHGVYLTSNGYSSSELIIHDFEVNCPSADREHMAIAGVENVIISDWDITGNKPALVLNSPNGGGINNGTVGLYSKIPPSQSPGWKAYQKVKLGKSVLSDEQIDALAYNRG